MCRARPSAPTVILTPWRAALWARLARHAKLRAEDDGIRQGVVQALLADRGPRSWVGIHPYAKWQGVFWRLLSVVGLDVDPAHPRIPRMADSVLNWLTSDQRRARLRSATVNGRVRWCATQDGLGLYWHYDVLVGLRALATVDMLRHPNAADALDVLEAARSPSGTWRTSGRRHWRSPSSSGCSDSLAAAPSSRVSFTAARWRSEPPCRLRTATPRRWRSRASRQESRRT